GDPQVARVELGAGERLAFTLSWFSSHAEPPRRDAALDQLQATTTFWSDWSARCAYDGPYRDAVVSSLVVLKGLTYLPTGAIVALAARIAGGRAQLGLSLLLAARRDADPARFSGRRLRGGGRGLAELAAARGGRRSG